MPVPEGVSLDSIRAVVALLEDMAGGGGGGSSDVNVLNFPATQPVSGTVTVTGIATAGSTNIGSTSAAAYADDTGADAGTLVGLLKGIYVQNAAIIALLTAIETNTGTP